MGYSHTGILEQMQQEACELRKKREKWVGQLEALQWGAKLTAAGKAAGHRWHFAFFYFLIYFIFLF